MGFDQEAAAVMMSRIAVFRYVCGYRLFSGKNEGEREKRFDLLSL